MMIVVTVAALSLDEELSVGAGASELELDSVGALSELDSVEAGASLLDSVAAGSVYEESWDEEDSAGADSLEDSLGDSVDEGASVPTTVAVASGKSVVVE
jgi:hypothetical protein